MTENAEGMKNSGQVEKSFLQNEGGYRDGLKYQKGRNKGSLHSKDAPSYMTPSLYLCVIQVEKSFLQNERGCRDGVNLSLLTHPLL